jgi:hypothetical protein
MQDETYFAVVNDNPVGAMAVLSCPLEQASQFLHEKSSHYCTP